MESYFVSKMFKGETFVERRFDGEYEACDFLGCDFSGADLSQAQFLDCSFHDCNLSLAVIVQTSWRSVHFKNCKLLGLRFDQSNAMGFSVGFEQCLLDHASFYRLKLKKSVFRHCKLHEVDFAESDLSEAVFDHCDLSNAVFDNTTLEGADFRSATNYSIDPSKNRLKKAKFSLPHVLSLLDRYGIEISPI